MKHFGFLLLAACLLVTGRASAALVLYINDANNNIGTVDLVTGAVTVIGNTGVNVTGIAFDPSGDLYGISSTDLYQINVSTGVAKDIGPTLIPDGDALVFDGDGDLFAAGGGTNVLYFLDSATGTGFAYAEIGFDSAGNLAFNGGELYLSATTNQLIEIDPNTLVSTVEGNFSFPNVVGLASGDNGVLYGVSGTTIFSIDTATGAGTPVLDYGGKGLAAAAGAAFSDEATPYITSASTATGQIAANFNFQLTAANNPFFFDAAGLPAGLSVNNSTGLIYGTPTEIGTFSVLLYAYNPGGGIGTAALTITVSQEPVPVVTSASSATAKTNQFFFYQIAASNAPTSFTAGAIPAGLTFYPSEGVISGTPTQIGTSTISFTATNSGGTAGGSLTLRTSAGPPVREVVTLSASIPQVTAGTGRNGEFLVTRLGANRSANLRVDYTIKGSAVNGSDYALVKDFVILKPGQVNAKIPIRPLGDGAGPGVTRSVILALANGTGYIPETPSSRVVKIVGH